jgi:Fibronectin type III domain
VAHTMLARLKTMARRKRPLALASVFVTLAMLVASTAARAQTTTTTTGPTITPTSQINPTRLLPNGQAAATRPINLNPTGINYSDCINDLTLEFSVEASNFTGVDTLEVWATNQGDCTVNTTRGIDASAAACWQVSQGIPGLVSAGMTENFSIKVRDIVGPQNAPPYPAGFAETEAHGELLGTAACATQPSFLAVPMYIWFLAVDGGGNSVGSPYEYGATTTTPATPFNVDLIGPPAPVSVTEAVGDTLFIASWTANVDSDTAGYDVFIDPIPGQEATSTNGGSSQQVLYCPDSGTTGATQVITGSGDDASDSGDDGEDAATTTTSSGADASCFYITAGGPSTNTTCGDSTLASGFVEDSGATTSTEVDGSVETGIGGNSTIPCANLIGGCGATTPTVSSNQTGTYTITGLKNGTTYNVVVAAVDGSGNIGPPSAEVCDYPAPVNDFWNLYRNAGGRAGGGFCALEAVGEPVPAAAGVAMFVGTGLLAARRRRSRRGRGEAGSQAAQREPRR